MNSHLATVLNHYAHRAGVLAEIIAHVYIMDRLNPGIELHFFRCKTGTFPIKFGLDAVSNRNSSRRRIRIQWADHAFTLPITLKLWIMVKFQSRFLAVCRSFCWL